MTDMALVSEDNIFAQLDTAPQTLEKRSESDELNMDELDDVSGGLFPLLVAGAYVGLVGYAIYRNSRH